MSLPHGSGGVGTRVASAFPQHHSITLSIELDWTQPAPPGPRWHPHRHPRLRSLLCPAASRAGSGASDGTGRREGARQGADGRDRAAEGRRGRGERGRHASEMASWLVASGCVSDRRWASTPHSPNLRALIAVPAAHAARAPGRGRPAALGRRPRPTGCPGVCRAAGARGCAGARQEARAGVRNNVPQEAHGARGGGREGKPWRQWRGCGRGWPG